MSSVGTYHQGAGEVHFVYKHPETQEVTVVGRPIYVSNVIGSYHEDVGSEMVRMAEHFAISKTPFKKVNTAKVDLNKLMGEDAKNGEHLALEGSLTTPPYTKANWKLMTPIVVHPDALVQLRKQHPEGNARQAIPTDDRIVRATAGLKLEDFLK